jgi:hypothetical protein
MGQPLSTVPASRRRLLLLGNEADLARIRLAQETRQLLTNPVLRFVRIDDDDELSDPICQTLARNDLLQPRSLLVQLLASPNAYARLSETSDQTARLKLTTTVRVCQLLGAKSVQIKEVYLRSTAKDSSQSASAGVGPPIKIEASHSSGTVELGREALQVSYKFIGSAPNVDEAEQALATSGIREPSLENLIAFFRTDNVPVSHEVQVSTLNEMRKVREWLGGITFPHAFSARVEAESFSSSAKSYEFSLWVEFPAPTSVN